VDNGLCGVAGLENTDIERRIHGEHIEITNEHVTQVCIKIAEARQLTRIIYIDLLTFLQGGASDEKKFLEELTVAKKQATAVGSKTLIVIDLDSLASTNISRSESAHGGDTRSVGNHHLFSSIIEMFLDCRQSAGMKVDPQNAIQECWALIMVRDPYLLDAFRGRTAWPLTEAEEKKRLRDEVLAKPLTCTRCHLQYRRKDEADKFPHECAYHPAALVEYDPDALPKCRRIRTKEEAMLRKVHLQDEKDLVSQSSSKVKCRAQVMWLCCFAEPNAAGCRRTRHTRKEEKADLSSEHYYPIPPHMLR